MININNVSNVEGILISKFTATSSALSSAASSSLRLPPPSGASHDITALNYLRSRYFQVRLRKVIIAVLGSADDSVLFAFYFHRLLQDP